MQSKEYKQLQVNLSGAVNESNLYIQITSGNVTKTLEYFPANFLVNIQENYGILKVLDQKTLKPLPKIYVKCFMRNTSGSNQFYKDGYTDMRGSFDYARLNTDKISSVDQFAILVSGDDGQGLVVKYAKPPSKIGNLSKGNLIGPEWRKRQREALASMTWE